MSDDDRISTDVGRDVEGDITVAGRDVVIQRDQPRLAMIVPALIIGAAILIAAASAGYFLLRSARIESETAQEILALLPGDTLSPDPSITPREEPEISSEDAGARGAPDSPSATPVDGPTQEVAIEPTETPYPRRSGTGWIAFVSNRDGNPNIYLVDADCTEEEEICDPNPVRLTHVAADNWHPAWSPDGRRIAFNRYQNVDNDIYLMNADGGSTLQLTDDRNNNHHASWSPDGRRLAFVSNRDGDEDIYVMDIDGSNVVQLTNSPGSDVFPDWSPDGSQIVFQSLRDGDTEIYLMDAGGSQVVQLTNNVIEDEVPDWSPDGSQIVFQSLRDGDWDIYLMNADGGSALQLTDDSASDQYPAWSLDGKKIAFRSDRDGTWDIYIMDNTGSDVIQLTDDAATEWDIVWQP